MPKQYEAIRDSLIKRGVSEKDAKREAAATYNKNRKPGTLALTPATAKRIDAIRNAK